MSPQNRTIQMSADALLKVASMKLPGAPLATWMVLLAHLNSEGWARVTQPELEEILDTGGGRVWQSLQALVEAGLILPPTWKRGYGRRTPYRIPDTVAVVVDEEEGTTSR